MTGILKNWSATASSNTTSATGIAVDNGTLFGSDHGAIRSIMAAIKAAFNQITGAKTSGGSANAYTFTSDTAGAISTAYAAGMRFTFKASFTSTGAATLNVDGVGAVAIKKGALDVSAGDISSGCMYDVAYDGTYFQMVNVPVAAAIGQESGHRISLTTAVSVTTSDVTGASTIYSTPDRHGVIPLYDGAAFQAIVQSELSLALDSNSGHTNYHQSGKNYDVWYFDDSGTKRIGTGAAWSSDTARADALTRLNGVYVNNATISAMRFGSSSGNTVSVAANKATYLGTIRCTADGQTEDSYAKRFVWNMYNRRSRAMRVFELTDSWTYSSSTIRQANAATANQLSFVRGLDEDAVAAQMAVVVQTASGTVNTTAGLGVDSITAYTRRSLATTTTGFATQRADWAGNPGLGYHYISWLEAGAGSDTQTWYGDAGGTFAQGGIAGTVFA